MNRPGLEPMVLLDVERCGGDPRYAHAYGFGRGPCMRCYTRNDKALCHQKPLADNLAWLDDWLFQREAYVRINRCCDAWYAVYCDAADIEMSEPMPGLKMLHSWALAAHEAVEKMLESEAK